MNSGFLLVNGPVDAPTGPEKDRQVASWRRLLAECGRKPNRKRVHDLRVATLRLQTELEFRLREQEPDEQAARVAKRWNKQAEKLRRALKSVRETDVFLAKLTKLRGSKSEPGDGRLQCDRVCLQQMAELERRLLQQRRMAAKKLVSEIEDRRGRLERLSREIQGALAPRHARAGDSTGHAVGERLARIAGKFPTLDGGCLHEFRKEIKSARYLAELSVGRDPVAKRQADALSRMQSAAGEWHDWEALAKRAGRALNAKDAEDGVVELLETLAAESLQRALVLCRRSMARLLRRRAGSDELPQALPPRLPVRSAEPEDAEERRLYA
jgi:CHAD domain-containing protein